MDSGTKQSYSIIVGSPNGIATVFFANSDKNLVQEYKDSVLTKNKFLIWENGCIEMKNVLGVFM